MRTLTTALLLAAFLAAPCGAQVAWIYESTTPGVIHDVYLNSAAYPAGAPGVFSPLPAPMTGGLVPAIAAPVGGVGADATTGLIYVSDGIVITTDNDPLYVGITPPVVPFPLAPVPIPGLGPITGLGADPVGGTLWASTPTFVVPLPLAPPYIPLGPPIPIPGLVGAPVSGLDFEPSSGTLWAVDVIGNVFNFTTAGVPIGVQPVVTVAPATPLPMRGLGINQTNGAGAFPAPACSTQTGGQHVVLTDGIFVYDAIPGTTPMTPVPVGPLAGAPYGMTCLPDHQTSLGFAGCTSTATVLVPPLVGTTGSAFVGAGAFNGFALRGGPPSTVVDIWVDLCPIPGGLPIPFGQTLWLNPFSSSLAMGSAITDAFGNATIPFSLVPAPAGVQLTFQWILTDTAHPLGVCLTDAATFTTGLP